MDLKQDSPEVPYDHHSRSSETKKSRRRQSTSSLRCGESFQAGLDATGVQHHDTTCQSRETQEAQK
jgi:hypothetical protein